MTCFIHTADWQLGKPFANIGNQHKRSLVQQARINVIKRISHLIKEHRARFVLVAGDLFATISPDKSTVAAVVRLVMAELLAADHDGKLPIVFDDAFAYSDQERVKTLQRMLDLAADRGVQVIVLSCNPADYVGLGARLTRLDGSLSVMG